MNKKKSVTVLVVLGLISMMILTTDSVCACYCEVGTFENDYITTKESFFKGETVYCKGEAYGYNYPLKLRIVDPNNNVVYYTDQSTSVVFGSFFLNETSEVGIWTIQLGTYNCCKWHWSTCSAYFSVSDVNYTLTINVVGSGNVTVDPELDYYQYGSLVNLTAYPDCGWEFAGWSGDLTGSTNPTNITMDDNKTVIATFTKILQVYYILTINVIGNGYVTPASGGLYLDGTVLELEATADTGWVFDNWSGDLSGKINPVTINITGDKNITAHFIKSNNGGGESGRVTIKPNKHPVADLSGGEPYIGFIYEEIEFNASLSYDSDGHIVKYKWVFGDGTTGEGEIITHAYLTKGEYKVELKVTDNRCVSDTDETIAVIVVPNHSPSELVILGPSEGKVNINYYFSVFSTDDDQDEIKYTIDWGDGNIIESDYIPSGVLFDTSHMWLKPGEYNIKIKAEDGKTNTTKDLTIIIQEFDEPVVESNNFILILLGLLALILLILILLIAKRKKDKDKGKKK